MDAVEYLDVYDENGEPTGTFLRSEVHAKGLWHKAIHVWLINDRGELLIQRRSPLKENHPNQWDIPAAGHLTAGQEETEAAIRETKEELGIDVSEDNLELIGNVKQESASNGGKYINKEINNIYLVHTDKEIEQMTMQPEEVAELKYIDPKELKKIIDSEDPEFVRHKEEYAILFEFLGI